MHHVGRLSETAVADGPYERHSEHHTRFSIVDRTAGSVHQAITVAELGADGRVDSHLHAFEEGLYVLEGRLSVGVDGQVEELVADDFVFVGVGVPHALSNASPSAARWLELGAPQPGAGLDDTVFSGGHGPGSTTDARYRRGHFDLSHLPPASDTIGLAGFGTGNVGGASLEMLIDRNAGASQFNLFVVQYVPGGLIKEHDHPFEEAFFFVSGEMEAVLDGKIYTLRAGDYCWSAVGSMHAFTNRSNEPVRWIESQVPQPPNRHQARFREDWERLIGGAAESRG